MVKIKKTGNINFNKDVGALELSYRADRNTKWYAMLGNSLAIAHEVKHILTI